MERFNGCWFNGDSNLYEPLDHVGIMVFAQEAKREKVALGVFCQTINLTGSQTDSGI